MTAPTPEQMRALADRAELLQGDSDYDYVFVTNVMTALRAAADQLEAVRRTIEDYDEEEVDGRGLSDALEAILTADTVPQEDRDE